METETYWEMGREEETVDIQQPTSSLSQVSRDAVQASYAPARRRLCLGRGSPGSRQGSSKSSRGLSSERAQRLRGFCLRPRPPPEGPQKVHLRTSKEGGLCRDPETLSFRQILRAVFPDCLNVTASGQAQEPKMNQRTAGHGKHSQEHHSSKKTGRQVER